MLKLKLQYFGHLMRRVDSLEKTHAGRDLGQEEKGMTEDEMAGLHHWLVGRESEWTPGVGDGQGGLACCDSWGRKESDTTERLNWLKIMASGPVTSWQIDGETVTGFIFLGSKITADGHCSQAIKRCMLLGGKSMTNLESILKSRDVTLLTKVRLVKAMIFPVVMYGCESLSTEELMLLNCGVGEDSWESLGLQGDPTSPS